MHTYTGILLSPEKRWGSDTRYNMDGLCRHAKWNKWLKLWPSKRTDIVWFLLCEVPGVIKIKETKVEWSLPRVKLSRGNRSYWLRGPEFLLGMVKKSRNSGYNCTVLWTYLMQYVHVGAKLLQSCLTLCGHMDCSLPGSSVYRILQARTLEWVAMPSSFNLPDPGIEPTPPVAPAF